MERVRFPARSGLLRVARLEILRGEELVAEIAGAFVSASFGIVPTVRHADYISSWLEVLREDNRTVVRAASAASKVANFLLAFLPPAISSGSEGHEEAW